MKSAWWFLAVIAAVIGGTVTTLAFGDARWGEPIVQHQKQHVCLSLLDEILFLERQVQTPEVAERLKKANARYASQGCATT